MTFGIWAKKYPNAASVASQLTHERTKDNPGQIPSVEKTDF